MWQATVSSVNMIRVVMMLIVVTPYVCSATLLSTGAFVVETIQATPQ